MGIPYGRQSISDADIAAVADVLRGDWLTIGPMVGTFEKAIAEVASTPDAVAVNSGTSALHSAYAASGITRGDEVVTTPLTFVATAATAMAQGATIRFADIQPDTGNIDPTAVAEQINERTKVVAAVDYAGHPADLDDLSTIAHDAGALLLEDAAHAIGSIYRGRVVGSISDLTTFSFFPTKNMTTAEGGAVVSPDPALIDGARRFKGHGMVRDRSQLRYPDEGPWHQEVQSLGLNYRLPDVLCALGVSQIARIAEFKQRRTAIFDHYVASLSDVPGLTLPTKREDVDPMWHLFPVRVHDGQRRRVFDHLRDNGVLVQVNYIPVYWHPVFEDLGYRRGMCPVAEQFYREEISLPMYADLSRSDQDRVIEVLRQALA
ncbi:UDP-4-amino-4,6-dideoxy-N-acetyl-beta-L-altrosamine transaminase [Leifsonia poae]|uniref:UDP-4-amino-4, 6-dideoxy-N-acetyl-beta-L-altrosamine transaminase n=1 Tax=Leifsonia poae TaxID=110933 RepID=UPI001CBCB16B|nr:UDP-4-amino-4,6-dideoxy-N-acetyl-beta-L-altrosamine transaminase [Leifsonia poae]